MTSLQQEIAAFSAEHAARVTEALKSCRTDRERLKCLKAYGTLGRYEIDIIAAKHGNPVSESKP